MGDVARPDLRGRGLARLAGAAGLVRRLPGAARPPRRRRASAGLFAAVEGVTGDTASAFEILDRADDWAGFEAAVDDFDSPSQNVVYADVDGNIGYAISGPSAGAVER